MRKFLCLLLTLLCMTSIAMASYGLRYKYFQIVDENGDPAITQGLKYTVETINTETAATIYYNQNYISSNAAAADTITNSATTLSTDTGSLGFFYAPATYDLKIENAGGNYIRFEDVTALQNVFVWPSVLSGYDTMSYTYGITAATGTFTGVLTLSTVTASGITTTKYLAITSTASFAGTVGFSTLTVTGTVDGRDISTDGTNLDATRVSTGTLMNSTTNYLDKSGGTMSGLLTMSSTTVNGAEGLSLSGVYVDTTTVTPAKIWTIAIATNTTFGGAALQLYISSGTTSPGDWLPVSP